MRAARVTDALAAHIHAYAETSAIVHLLTADLGSVRAVAKGARRVSNSFRGPLDKGVLYRVRLGRRGSDGLFHLHSASVREAFPALRCDPPRFHAAALAMEVAGDLMRENEPHAELFRLTVFSLKVLDRAPRERLGLVATFFLARAVAISGHVPEIGQCVACGRALLPDDRPLISAQRGGVVHPSCGQGEPGARTVAPSTLDLLDRLWRDPAARLLRSPADPAPLGALRRLLEDWLEQVLERRFRAVQPLEREIARVPA
jgi:DNA repair protein RecO (recombination protein O)